MSSEKAVYWVAVAIMALFVGNHFASKYQGSCLADRPMSAVQHLGAEVTRVAVMAQATLSGTPSFAAKEAVLARVQGHLASVEASMARQQAACARLQAQHARMIALQQVQNLRVVCPKQSITVELPRIPQFVSE
jgi:hypothetical protein